LGVLIERLKHRWARGRQAEGEESRRKRDKEERRRGCLVLNFITAEKYMI
jgi:hypothetical protein